MANNQNLAGRYLTFILNEQHYGVPIASIREINRMAAITAVPNTPKFVRGVINLRGKVIPIIDLRAKFALPDSPITKISCIIVIQVTDGEVGVIVDTVSAVVQFSEDDIDSSTNLYPKDSDIVLGMGKQADKVVILVNLAKTLTREEMSKTYEQVKGNLKDVA